MKNLWLAELRARDLARAARGRRHIHPAFETRRVHFCGHYVVNYDSWTRLTVLGSVLCGKGEPAYIVRHKFAVKTMTFDDVDMADRPRFLNLDYIEAKRGTPRRRKQ